MRKLVVVARAGSMKKIIVAGILLVGAIWSAQAMESGLHIEVSEIQAREDQAPPIQSNLEEKGSPEIELLIPAQGDDQQPGTGWSSIHEFLSEADKKELSRNHTDQELDEVFKTFIKPQDAADCMQNFLIALIKRDTARKADAQIKMKPYSFDRMIFSHLGQIMCLGSIAIVIMLCGAIRIQCGN